MRAQKYGKQDCIQETEKMHNSDVSKIFELWETCPPDPVLSHPPGRVEPNVGDLVESIFASKAVTQVHKNRVIWRNVSRMSQGDIKKEARRFGEGHKTNFFLRPPKGEARIGQK